MKKLTSQIGAVTLQTMIAIFGVTIGTALYLATGGCSGMDTATGLTCEELVENPDQDVYFVVSSTYFNDPTIWETAQGTPETSRWNVAENAFFIKYNAKDVPEDQTGFLKPLNNPMTGEEASALSKTSAWSDQEIVGEDYIIVE